MVEPAVLFVPLTPQRPKLACGMTKKCQLHAVTECLLYAAITSAPWPSRLVHVTATPTPSSPPTRARTQIITTSPNACLTRRLRRPTGTPADEGHGEGGGGECGESTGADTRETRIAWALSQRLFRCGKRWAVSWVSGSSLNVGCWLAGSFAARETAAGRGQ